MILQKFLNELFGHKHYPKYIRDDEILNLGRLSSLRAIYSCKDCGIEGHREKWPNEETTIWWHHT